MLHSPLLIKRVFSWLFWAAVEHLFFQSLLFSCAENTFCLCLNHCDRRLLINPSLNHFWHTAKIIQNINPENSDSYFTRLGKGRKISAWYINPRQVLQNFKGAWKGCLPWQPSWEWRTPLVGLCLHRDGEKVCTLAVRGCGRGSGRGRHESHLLGDGI